MEKKRFIFIDLLKIIASFLVIINHTITESFVPIGVSFTWLSGVILFTFSKIAVPIYLLISGFLMFQKIICLRTALTKFFQMFLIFIFGTALHYFFYDMPEKNIATFLKLIYSTHITNIYWYMFLYLGIIIMSPLISAFLNALNTKYLIYALSINVFFVNFLPILLKRLQYPPISSLFSSILFPESLTYILIGYLIYRKHETFDYSIKRTALTIFVFFASWLQFIGLLMYEKIYETGINTFFWDDRYAFHIILLSVSSFLILMQFTPEINNQQGKKIIIRVSQASFFIFFISDLIIFLITKIGITSFLVTNISQLFLRQVILGILVYFTTISIGLIFYSVRTRLKILFTPNNT